jgi:adenylate kinase
LKIIFIGAPGSGKGTQSREFIDKYGYVQLSTGDLIKELRLLRELIWDCLAKILWIKVSLVPDEVMIGLVKTYLSKQSDKSVILDGFPRTVAQAASLDRC